MADAFARFFAKEGEAAASSATEAAFAVAWSFNERAGKGGDGARFVVDVAIAAEITRVVEDDCFVVGSFGRRG